MEKCVTDIISDMRLTVSSLDSKKALTNIDKVYMDYVTSNLHAGMCEKNKLRVYRELKEKFECIRNTCMERLTWVPSFCLDLDLVPMG